MARIPCKGKTTTGAACQAPAGSGGLCFFHANPDSAKALGRIGGRKNRRSVVDLRVPDNMTAADVCNVTGQAIRLLLSGELKAREASALAQLCNSIYRVLPTADLEARVALLEEKVAQEESGTLPDLDSTTSPAQRTEATETDAELQVPSSMDTPKSAPPNHEEEVENTSNGCGESEEA